jgi:DNA ligase-1
MDTQHLHKVKVVETHRVTNDDSVNYFYAKWVSAGYEGLMYRLGDCPYTTPSAGRGISDKNNRTWHLLKRKDFQDAEFRILDVEEGLGKRTGMVGAFLCETADKRQFKVGTGLSDNEATHYLENPPIGKLLKVKYLCLTENKIPFNPTILAVLE